MFLFTIQNVCTWKTIKNNCLCLEIGVSLPTYVPTANYILYTIIVVFCLMSTG